MLRTLGICPSAADNKCGNYIVNKFTMSQYISFHLTSDFYPWEHGVQDLFLPPRANDGPGPPCRVQPIWAKWSHKRKRPYSGCSEFFFYARDWSPPSLILSKEISFLLKREFFKFRKRATTGFQQLHVASNSNGVTCYWDRCRISLYYRFNNHYYIWLNFGTWIWP